MFIKHTFICALLLTLTVRPAHAELSKCNGIWTNQPCNQDQKELALPEKPLKKIDPAAKILSQKRSLLHDLTVSRLNAKKEYGITISSSNVEETCLLSETTIKECRELVAEKKSEILENSKLKALSIQENNKKDSESKEVDNSQNVSVVIHKENNNRYIYIPRDRRRNKGGFYISGSYSNSNGSYSGTISSLRKKEIVHQRREKRLSNTRRSSSLRSRSRDFAWPTPNSNQHLKIDPNSRPKTQ